MSLCLVCGQPSTTNRTFDLWRERVTRHFCKIHAAAFDLRTQGAPARRFHDELARMIHNHNRSLTHAHEMP